MMMVAAPVMVVVVIVSVGVMIVRVSHGAYVSPTSGAINAITSNACAEGASWAVRFSVCRRRSLV